VNLAGIQYSGRTSGRGRPRSGAVETVPLSDPERVFEPISVRRGFGAARLQQNSSEPWGPTTAKSHEAFAKRRYAVLRTPRQVLHLKAKDLIAPV
jgi:hypothetical protein